MKLMKKPSNYSSHIWIKRQNGSIKILLEMPLKLVPVCSLGLQLFSFTMLSLRLLSLNNLCLWKKKENWKLQWQNLPKPKQISLKFKLYLLDLKKNSLNKLLKKQLLKIKLIKPKKWLTLLELLLVLLPMNKIVGLKVLKKLVMKKED